jgi:hypothetical protein
MPSTAASERGERCGDTLPCALVPSLLPKCASYSDGTSRAAPLASLTSLRALPLQSPEAGQDSSCRPLRPCTSLPCSCWLACSLPCLHRSISEGIPARAYQRGVPKQRPSLRKARALKAPGGVATSLPFSLAGPDVGIHTPRLPVKLPPAIRAHGTLLLLFGFLRRKIP